MSLLRVRLTRRPVSKGVQNNGPVTFANRTCGQPAPDGEQKPRGDGREGHRSAPHARGRLRIRRDFWTMKVPHIAERGPQPPSRPPARSTGAARGAPTTSGCGTRGDSAWDTGRGDPGGPLKGPRALTAVQALTPGSGEGTVTWEAADREPTRCVASGRALEGSHHFSSVRTSACSRWREPRFLCWLRPLCPTPNLIGLVRSTGSTHPTH